MTRALRAGLPVDLAAIDLATTDADVRCHNASHVFSDVDVFPRYLLRPCEHCTVDTANPAINKPAIPLACKRAPLFVAHVLGKCPETERSL
jgi:hypothetical protein